MAGPSQCWAVSGLLHHMPYATLHTLGVMMLWVEPISDPAPRTRPLATTGSPSPFTSSLWLPSCCPHAVLPAARAAPAQARSSCPSGRRTASSPRTARLPQPTSHWTQPSTSLHNSTCQHTVDITHTHARMHAHTQLTCTSALKAATFSPLSLSK